MRSGRERVQDMLSAVAAIERHVEQRRQAFDTDEVLRGYVVYQLMILGEAAYSMPEAVKVAHSEIRWGEITSMRHLLVHGYFRVDRDIVWNVVERDLPVLRPQLERLLSEIAQHDSA